MKKILVVCIGSLFLITLSGCSLGDIVDRFSDSEDTQIQDINPGSTRVYMDEIRVLFSILPVISLLFSADRITMSLIFPRQLWNVQTECSVAMLSA